MIAIAQKRETRARKMQALQIAGQRTHHSATTRRDYAGHELAPYAGRPGSLDHLDLPSRTGNTLHFRSRESIKTVFQQAMS